MVLPELVLDSFDLPELPDSARQTLHALDTLGGGRSREGRAAKAIVNRFGGKATMLADLISQGFPVPPGWVLDASVFTRVVDERLPRGHDIATLIKSAGSQEGMDRAARARDRILDVDLPPELHEALETLATLMAPHAPWGFSVRSSATSEDARTSSLAGLATSLLGVRGVEGLEGAVRQVWASLYLPRTLLYLQRWGIKKIAMPVLVMPMVEATAAGVLFTSPPTGLAGPRWEESERLVHATFGLGSPVVDGATVVDTVRLTKSGAVVERVIAEKSTEFVVTEAGFTAQEITGERRTEPCLSAHVLEELSRIANFLVERHQSAMDVEFAVAREPHGAERVVLLQARPVTGGLFPDGGTETTVWSRANVGEALPGAATPLTWSVARRFSDSGFRAAFAALGCKVPKGDVLVSNVYGRFYLNLSAFMNVAAQVPGLSPRALLEQSGGAPEGLIRVLEQTSEPPSKGRFVFKAPFTLPSLLLRGLRLPVEVDLWEIGAEKRRRQLVDMDLAVLPDDALAHTLEHASEMLVSAGELMLTCASASLASHLALKMWLKRILANQEHRFDHAELDQETSRIGQALTSGIAEIESANPGLSLLRIANIARGEPEALELLQAGIKTVAELPSGPTRAALYEFLDRFGDRAVKEAELSTPRWREDAAPLLSMLQASLRGPPVDPAAGPMRARMLADRELAAIETHGGITDVAVLRELVLRVQSYTRLRERMRAWVTKTLGLIRLVALDIDRRLRQIEPSLPPESVFFCTYAELFTALRTGRADVAHIIRLRRAEHLRDRARPDPPSTFVGRPPAVSLPPSAAPKLIGLAASAGVVEGIARVVGPGADPATALCPGEILVARTTDIGMSPLFLVAAAVVTELGGPLSHAAIVAREYNVPAVVNVDGCTLSIRTGERIRVDGDRGTVERLDAPKPPAEDAAAEGSASAS